LTSAAQPHRTAGQRGSEEVGVERGRANRQRWHDDVQLRWRRSRDQVARQIDQFEQQHNVAGLVDLHRGCPLTVGSDRRGGNQFASLVAHADAVATLRLPAQLNRTRQHG
jgi:hypothetical protein